MAAKQGKPKQDPKNFRFHGERNKELINKSLTEFGAGRSILLDNDNFIIAGNGVSEQAEQLDIPIRVIETDGTELIAVKRTDIGHDDPKRKELALADNATTDSSDWDTTVLQENWTTEELEEWDIDLSELEEEEIEPEEDDFNQPLPTHPKTVLGDLYELHSLDKGLVHRVQCGDSTDSEVVAKLMDGVKADIIVTDPPYNTGMTSNGDEKARLSHMFNDSFTDEEWGKFLTAFFSNYHLFSKGECAIYVFIDWRRVNDMRSALEQIADVKNVVVWDKKVHGLGSDYKSTYELCIVGKKGKPEINNRFGLDYQDIWRVQRSMGRNKDHATAKPVELISKPIKHASKKDDIVFDLFLGSGTTLVTSEQLERNCYGQELDEKYTDITVKRWAKYMTDNDLEFKILRNGEEITEEEWILETKEA